MATHGIPIGSKTFTFERNELPEKLATLLLEDFQEDRFVLSHIAVVRGSKLATAGYLKLLSLTDSVLPPPTALYDRATLSRSSLSELDSKERRAIIATISTLMKSDSQLLPALVMLKRIETLLSLASQEYYRRDNADAALEFLYEAFSHLGKLLGESHAFTLAVASIIHEIHLAQDATAR